MTRSLHRTGTHRAEGSIVFLPRSTAPRYTCVSHGTNFPTPAQRIEPRQLAPRGWQGQGACLQKRVSSTRPELVQKYLGQWQAGKHLASLSIAPEGGPSGGC